MPNRDTFSGSFSLHCGAARHHWGVFFWTVSILLQSPLTNSWAALNQLWWKWWIHRSPEYADVLFWDKVRMFCFRHSLSGLFSLQCGAEAQQRKTVLLCECLANICFSCSKLPWTILLLPWRFSWMITSTCRLSHICTPHCAASSLLSLRPPSSLSSSPTGATAATQWLVPELILRNDVAPTLPGTESQIASKYLFSRL